MKGRQWLAFDAYFFGKPFPIELQERFGPTGVVLFVAFLCACKRSQPQGQISYMSDTEALHQMGLDDCLLVDSHGEKWSLDEFWTFTGRMKQTKKTARGRVRNVISTHWERWQDVARRDMAAERQRRSRAKNGRDTGRDEECDSERDDRVTDIDLDLDSDIDIPQTPPGVEPPAPRTNSRNNGTNPRARGTNPRALVAEAHREIIPDWEPDSSPDEAIIDRAASESLRANLTPPTPPKKNVL